MRSRFVKLTTVLTIGLLIAKMGYGFALVDPTCPPGQVSDVARFSEVWQVSAIVKDHNGEYQARIGDQWVTEGSRLDGAAVILVSHESVVLEKNGQTEVVTLVPSVRQFSKLVQS